MRDETGQTLEFTVTGMDCGSCAAKVQRAVERLPGVQGAEVALMAERLRLQVLPGGASGDEIERTIRAIGFGATLRGDPAPCCDPHKRLHEEGPHHEHDSHAEQRAAPVVTELRSDTPWHRSVRGRHLITTGLLLALAWSAELLLSGAVVHWTFVLACVLGALPVARRALALLRAGVPFTIEALMTIAAAGALVIGAAEEAALVVFLFAVGEMLESLAAARARRGIRALSALLPETALLIHGDHTHSVPAASLRPGQSVRLRPGDRLPCDGRILRGQAGLDESAITGESLPVLRGIGDAVMAGSICTDAVIDVEVTAAATENTIARIARMVEEAEATRAPTQRFIERFARIYMPVILGLSVAVAILPPLVFGGAWGDWAYRALALLLVGCPCALVISVPAAVASALATGTRAGILFKGGAALEATARLRHVAFDKTGTLTEGRFSIVAVYPVAGRSEEEVLTLAASVEAGSTHPLARAILEGAEARGLPLLATRHARGLPGVGAEAQLGGALIRAVGLRHAGEDLPADLLDRARLAEARGESLVVLLRDGEALGLIALADRPRAEAGAALAALRGQGLHPVMLTGDNAGVARAVAEPLGLDPQANLLPQDKLAALGALSVEGGVMMVGDGINDAPALKRATIGVAMGSGTDVALEAADAAILHNDLRGVPAMIDLARRTRANILQNVIFALGLKAVFLGLSVTGEATLWMAVLADTGATVLVTLNALRLQRWRMPG
ncbi:heavy metal translocating P-type ATPase [Tabrizicola sp. TH137]|uniref:heavy metal translocating P-type ATPase n=1 Tax=Tabrizicola sp. TH137 TaxID=2067452 RepID=UPI000C7B8654|nr:heavy metal translocating P-type ATPase [Tabrizicola sp. TH137]PLL12928.1 heavy metal translocating P-type ATPase [Tabrizicola sp. TH137]